MYLHKIARPGKKFVRFQIFLPEFVVNALLAAGYDRRAAVAIALAAGAKTLVNTVAHLSHAVIDDGFQPKPVVGE